MNLRTRLSLLTLTAGTFLGLVPNLLAAKATGTPPPEDFSQTALGAGLYAGFGLLRLGGSERLDPLPLQGHALERPDALLRVLIDPASGSAFGYRLEVNQLSSTLYGALRVDIHPLDAFDEKEVKRLSHCATCPAPHLLPSSPTRFPPTQVIRAGDTMLIDLLVRQETGEKIVDVVKFAFETVTQRALDDVRARVTEAFQHAKQADLLSAKGSFDAAAIEYGRALNLRLDAATEVRLAQCDLKLGRTAAAEQAFEKAVRLNASDAEAWYGLSVLQHRRGLFGKAINGYERALKLRPAWPLARRNLATARLDRAELDAAFEGYREALHLSRTALDMNDADCVRARDPGLQEYVFAKVYAAEGDVDAAVASLRKAKESGFRDLERIRQDSEFRPFLADPRLVALADGAHS